MRIWRHPKPEGAQGRCIGAGSDLPVDRRKAKRLAHRIRAEARRQRWPRAVVTSPLRRCAEVGRWLRRWGWQHRLDAALLEFDFGAWDGQRWDAIGAAPLDAWCADFADHHPGDGPQSLRQFLDRVAAWQPAGERCAVGHGGWMRGRAWRQHQAERCPSPLEWAQQQPGYGRSLGLDGGGGASGSSSLGFC